MMALALFLVLFSLCCSCWWIISSKSKRKLAPGPLAIPVLGHLHLLGKNPHKSLSDLSKIYGSVMSIKLGKVLTLVISSPDAAKAVLSTHDIAFASRPKLAAPKYSSYNYKDMAWSDYGSYWRKMRKICTVELFTARRIDESQKMRMEEISRLIRSIGEEGRSGEVPVNMNTKLSMANINFISLLAFSTRMEDSDFLSLMQETIDLIGGFVPSDYFPFLRWMDDFGTVGKMKVARSKLDKVFQRIIDGHRRSAKNLKERSAADLVDVLLSLDDLTIDDEGRKALILDIFAAGTDTSSITTEWALSELIKNPSCMIKAQQEIDRVVGHQRDVTEEDLSDLTYLRAVVRETFRLHPAAPLLIPHQSTDDCMVNGFFVPAKTRLFVNVWAIGRDSRWWGSPEVFNPERFLGDSPPDIKGQHFELLPFGSGRRMCPGMNLGLIMVEISLARLIQAFDWTSKEKYLDMEEEFGIILRRKTPLMALAKPRKH